MSEPPQRTFTEISPDNNFTGSLIDWIHDSPWFWDRKFGQKKKKKKCSIKQKKIKKGDYSQPAIRKGLLGKDNGEVSILCGEPGKLLGLVKEKNKSQWEWKWSESKASILKREEGEGDLDPESTKQIIF